mmetsp:Transcript_134857/g.430983  ORF Transcript_134857/g.430983 Transcript_134857/m.430983 type:complete len:221 (+) Transcript_134857:616-1278(+)
MGSRNHRLPEKASGGRTALLRAQQAQRRECPSDVGQALRREFRQAAACLLCQCEQELVDLMWPTTSGPSASLLPTDALRRSPLAKDLRTRPSKHGELLGLELVQTTSGIHRDGDADMRGGAGVALSSCRGRGDGRGAVAYAAGVQLRDGPHGVRQALRREDPELARRAQVLQAEAQEDLHGSASKLQPRCSPKGVGQALCRQVLHAARELGDDAVGQLEN